MRLTELEPRWWISTFGWTPAEPWPRYGMGVTFLCPVHRGACAIGRIAVPFANPLDGGSKSPEGQGANKDTWWQRTGEDFDTLSLTPSVDVKEEGQTSHWHGHVTAGEVR